MNIIICLDDDNGFLFNGRRQSKDIAVINDMKEYIAGKEAGVSLLMNTYSSGMFSDGDLDGKISFTDEYLSVAGESDYCFVESSIPMDLVDTIEHVVVYRWNRKYPSDVKISRFLNLDMYGIMDVHEFPGNSHELITREIYTKIHE